MLVGLLGGLLLASTGCCGARYGTCGSCGPMGPNLGVEPCDEGCGPTCGPSCGPVRRPLVGSRRVAVCDDCGCDPCGCNPCGGRGRCWYRGPLSCVFALFTPGFWCGPNCGGRYWGDFYSDPPNCQDPCDCYGNYAGGSPSTGVEMEGEYREGGCPHCNRSAHGVQPGGNTQLMPAEDDGDMVSSTERKVTKQTRSTNEPHRAARR